MPFYEDYGSDFDFQFSPQHKGKHGNLAGMHIHPHYEILIVANETQQKATINGNELPLIHRPSLTVFSPYSMHQVNFIEDSQAERFIFYFGNTMTEEFNNSLKVFKNYEKNVSTRFILSDSLLTRIRPFLNELILGKDDRDLSKLIFLSMIRIIMLEAEIDQILCPSQGFKKINDIIKYIVNHSNENLTTEMVCAEFYISRSKLTKDLKKYNINFHKFLKEVRLSQAFYMLKTTKMNISDIATSLGFENDTYFYTFFKNATGITPLQYRTSKPKG